jgi:hypothetical protein
MADLGDISGFLKEGAVNNLDWLDVNDKDYRELSDLPKQNLDFAPDLEAAWSHEGAAPSTYLVPNKDVPRTMGDLSEVHGKLASEEILQRVAKVARLALMQSTDSGKFVDALKTRFDPWTIQAARPLITSILQERGLLGRYYIDASDFPNCSKKASRGEVDFVKRNAGEARFLLAKDQCIDCVHNAKSTCSVFHKELVLEVPYSSELASAVERSQCACGKQAVQASIQDPRERIKAAYLAGNVQVTSHVETPKPMVNPVHQLKATVEPPKVHLPVLATQAQQNLAEQLAWVPPTSGKVASMSKDASSKKAFDVCSFLQREMLKGRSEKELLQALKLSFSLDDLRATRSSWEPLYKEAGLYGTVYSSQESFDNCHEGADFIAKHNHQIKGIVASQKCATCIYSKLNRCLVYGKPLVAKAEDLYTEETVKQALWDNKQAGRLGAGAESFAWGPTPVEALKAIYRTASVSDPQAHIPMRAYVEQAFRGSSTGYSTSGLTKREVVKTASRYMNEGLYGSRLLSALQARFDARDILSSKEELKQAMSEQGLQGIYYVDPTIYNDYAKGCDEGARLHRARQVPYVRKGEKCATCVLQPHPGFCSKYAKHLVIDPPYADKAAQQREILASGPADEISLGSLMISNPSSVADLVQLKSGMEIDLNPVPEKSATISVELGGATIDL